MYVCIYIHTSAASTGTSQRCSGLPEMELRASQKRHPKPHHTYLSWKMFVGAAYAPLRYYMAELWLDVRRSWEVEDEEGMDPSRDCPSGTYTHGIACPCV